MRLCPDQSLGQAIQCLSNDFIRVLNGPSGGIRLQWDGHLFLMVHPQLIVDQRHPNTAGAQVNADQNVFWMGQFSASFNPIGRKLSGINILS